MRKIQLRLRTIKVREIAQALQVSKPYAALIRAGRRRPHPRHWEALAELVGVPARFKGDERISNETKSHAVDGGGRS